MVYTYPKTIAKNKSGEHLDLKTYCEAIEMLMQDPEEQKNTVAQEIVKRLGHTQKTQIY